MRTARDVLRILACLGWSVLVAGSVATAEAASDFDPATSATLTLQLDIPARVASEIELDVQHVELRGASVGTLRLPVHVSRLSSTAMAGTRPVWVEAPVAPDTYDSMTIVLRAARIRVERAWTRADSAAHRIDLSLKRRFEAGEGVVLTVRWRVDAFSPDDPFWRPTFELQDPPSPALGQRLYVAQSASGTVGVVDRESGLLAATLPTGGRPTDLAWSEATRRLFVTVAGTDELVAFDVGEIDVPRRLPLRFGDGPNRVLVSDDQQRAAVTCADGNALVLVSAVSLVEIDRVSLPPRPVALAEDPASGRLYVSCELAGEIHSIDPRGTGAQTVISGLDAPQQLVFLSGDNRLAVSVARGRRIEFRDARSGELLESIDLCGPVRSLAYQPRSRRLFAALSRCDQIAVLRPDQAIEIDREDLPGAPGLIAIDPEDRFLLVPLTDMDRVLLLRTTRSGERRVLWTGRRPSAVIVP